MAAAAAAARTMLRSTATSGRSAAARVISVSRPCTTRSPFRIVTQEPLSARIFRSPVEMSVVSVQSMMPYHSATASSLLTSMLTITPRIYAWTIEDL